MADQAPQSVLFEGGYEGIKQSALDEVKESVQNAGYSLLIKSSGSSFVPAYTNYQYTPNAHGPEIVDQSGNAITTPGSNIFYGPYITLRQVVKTKPSSMNVGDTVTPANSFDSYLPSSVSVHEEDDANNRVSTLDNNIKVSISDPNGVLNTDHTKALRAGSFKITYTYDVGQSTTGTPTYPVSATATVTVNPTGTPSNGGGTTTPSGGGGTTAPSNGGATTPSNGGGTTTLPTSPIIATKGAAVYAVRSIGLYKTANFTKSTRRATYVKKPRINRPMFVVTGYAQASNGALRYKVRDVNHKSATAGMTGYITANTNYVLPVYYQRSYSKVTVINPSGIKAYNNVNLTGAAKAYKQGTVLTVVGIEHHNLTTRFLLSNGKYITANRKLVIAGHVKMVKLVKTKTTVNRYKTANLTGRNGVLKKNKTYRVYGFAYSRPTSTKTSGSLRYRVAGGYITANNKYIKAYK